MFPQNIFINNIRIKSTISALSIAHDFLIVKLFSVLEKLFPRSDSFKN